MAKIEIIALPQFEKELKLLSKKYTSIHKDFELLIQQLIENPFTGVSLGNNCFKVRMNIKSKRAGKSGGARVIICVKIISNRLFLVSIFDKADKESISKEFINQILARSGLL
ncbi:MAG: type II toxin-antitoxin system RelE/ParE family toxin [Ferruginibacter sp.]|nr:type II toxin-antitoxin system RelE/ParE family toxin [Ferruginibacter sp.]